MLLMIDLGISNLRSVINAFQRVGVDIAVSSDPDEIAAAPALVLPGVGAFEEAVNAMEGKNLADLIRSRAESGVPLLGICLGMQLLAEESYENGHYTGLGLIRGQVRRLESSSPQYRIPNIGWCDTRPAGPGVLYPEGVGTDTFYYVHSYHMCCSDPGDVAAVMDFSGSDVTVAVERGNIFGVQFHPEKSQDAGLDLIERFAGYLRSSGFIN